jgi:hypothetical protein
MSKRRTKNKNLYFKSYADNLKESGLHGALVADSSFNIDSLYDALRVDELKHQNIKKILEDEIKLLKKSKLCVLTINHFLFFKLLFFYSSLKPNSAFIRSIPSFKNEHKKMFTFRGSLGRALGKKLKRDTISSPLLDDDTYKRIEDSHKIIDIKKNLNISSAV